MKRFQILAATTIAVVLLFALLDSGLYFLVLHHKPKRMIPYWRLPDDRRQQLIREERLHAVTHIDLDDSDVTLTSFFNPRLKVQQQSSFPSWMLAEGATYGLSAWNGFQARASDVDNVENTRVLKQLIADLSPAPDGVYEYHSFSVDDAWEERGFAVYYEHTSNAIEKQLLFIARSFSQPCVSKWWATRWGREEYAVTPMISLMPTASGLATVRYEARTQALELHSSSWDAWVVKQKELSGLSVDAMNADGRWKQYGIDHVRNPPSSPPSRTESNSL